MGGRAAVAGTRRFYVLIPIDLSLLIMARSTIFSSHLWPLIAVSSIQLKVTVSCHRLRFEAEDSAAMTWAQVRVEGSVVLSSCHRLRFEDNALINTYQTEMSTTKPTPSQGNALIHSSIHLNPPHLHHHTVNLHPLLPPPTGNRPYNPRPLLLQSDKTLPLNNDDDDDPFTPAPVPAPSKPRYWPKLGGRSSTRVPQELSLRPRVSTSSLPSVKKEWSSQLRV